MTLKQFFKDVFGNQVKDTEYEQAQVRQVIRNFNRIENSNRRDISKKLKWPDYRK